MMKLNFYFRTAIVLIGLLFVGACLGCSNEKDGSLERSSCDISESKKFGEMHNECVADVLSFLMTEGVTRSNEFDPSSISDEVLASVCDYVNERSAETVLNIDDLRTSLSYDVPYIRRQMSVTELEFVDKALQFRDAGKSYDDLLYEVGMSDMPEENKEAMMNFISTLSSSSEYWETNRAEWVAFMESKVPEEQMDEFRISLRRVQWDVVVFSDAYYGWFATVGTGGNLLVGAGIAAAGSICSVLNYL